MDPLILLAVCAAAIFLFRWADRKVGSDDPNPKSSGYGAVTLFALITAGLASLDLPSLWPVVWLSLGWVIYRSLPWKVGGSLTPRTLGQALGSLLRHAMPLGMFALLWAAGGSGAAFPGLNLLPAAYFAAFAMVATAQHLHLGVVPGWAVKAVSEPIERWRGTFYGLALAGVALTA